ncbi:related to KRE6 Glucan synthase subunit [Phialocephala subalpina]|uniref:Related to KRE6 Glucan synthase subunit n=1 Tax=Phialocephala subalpina TaxID=576137 RepID=A0A1L7XB42_9HELO|nr:related to KRE6 Glucan synthase subunit [Phialocephala subalpina]
MAPLSKAPPIFPKGGEEMGDTEQTGRRSASLEAQRNSEELRSTTTTSNPFSPRTSSELVPQKSNSSTSIVDSRPELSNRRTSYVPVVPSPLNPASTQSSTSSIDGSDDTGVAEGDVSPIESASSVPRSRSTGNISNIERPPRRKASNLSPPQELLRQKSASQIKDLGHDYSRYPSSTDLRSNSRPPGPSPPGPRRPRSKPRATVAAVPLLRTTTTNPFSDSQANLEKWGYPDDSITAFNPYYGGEKGFILYANEIEADDSFHMPQDDDDIKLKPKLSEYFDPRQIVSTIGGCFLILGLLCVFVVLPVLTFQTHLLEPVGKGPVDDYGPAWAHVNNNSYPLLENVRTGLIDPDTPQSAKTRKSTFDGSTLNLVFSDEFNDDNRTFYPGDDPFWTAPNIWYGATQDLEWYDPDAVTTGNGTLQLRLDQFPNHNLQYRSGMLNSWNQMCFKGGVFEVSVSLAGPAGIPGLWPGVWSMGNLGRPGYKATTEGVWPYTYNSCDAGITPNQSSPDGLSFLPGQKLSSCTCKGEDHPNAGVGRGAPEIDILEASVDPNNRIGVVTQSFQVAPFDVFYRPNENFMAMPNYDTTQMNTYCGGPFQQAVSATTLLNNGWYDGAAYQKYAFEYIPGTSTGKIAWFVGEEPSFIMDGRAIGPNGNIAARQVSQEPMSAVLNLGLSNSWSEVLIGDLKFPTIMHIDYVRIYQKPGQTSVTCDPPGYPTTEYIKQHPVAYNNPNLTVSFLYSIVDWDEY